MNIAVAIITFAFAAWSFYALHQSAAADEQRRRARVAQLQARLSE